mmetsp:Transcript_23089/g.64553  ORF Transcript_23089/g.64553 Transcript_23089/m.64553 type:complete len:287 (-) Transcript_23089:36-896(-)
MHQDLHGEGGILSVFPLQRQVRVKAIRVGVEFIRADGDLTQRVVRHREVVFIPDLELERIAHHETSNQVGVVPLGVEVVLDDRRLKLHRRLPWDFANDVGIRLASHEAVQVLQVVRGQDADLQCELLPLLPLPGLHTGVHRLLPRHGRGVHHAVGNDFDYDVELGGIRTSVREEQAPLDAVWVEILGAERDLPERLIGHWEGVLVPNLELEDVGLDVTLDFTSEVPLGLQGVVDHRRLEHLVLLPLHLHDAIRVGLTSKRTISVGKTEGALDGDAQRGRRHRTRLQ